MHLLGKRLYFLMHFDVWTERNRKKKDVEFELKVDVQLKALLDEKRKIWLLTLLSIWLSNIIYHIFSKQIIIYLCQINCQLEDI